METDRVTWRIDLFGGLGAVSGGRTLPPFPTQKTGLLLARLAFPPQRPYTREQVIDLLWPDAELESGRNRLNQTMVWLRRHLEPEGAVRGSVLETQRIHVGLNPAAVSTDVADFEAALVAAERSGDSEERTKGFVRAVSLYSGELLPAFYEDWVLSERQRLLNAYSGAVRQLVRLREDAGDIPNRAGMRHLAWRQRIRHRGKKRQTPRYYRMEGAGARRVPNQEFRRRAR